MIGASKKTQRIILIYVLFIHLIFNLNVSIINLKAQVALLLLVERLFKLRSRFMITLSKLNVQTLLDGGVW